MAKIKFGLIVSEGRGAVGGIVLSRNKSGAYMRKNTSPINPSTSAQTAVRALFAVVSTAYKDLSVTQLASWSSAAASGQWNTTNSLGETVIPSGQQLFMRLNSGRVQDGLSIIQEVPAKATFVSSTYTLTAVTDTGVLDEMIFDLDTGSLPSGFKAQLFASAPHSPGIQAVGFVRKIDSLPSGSLPASLAGVYAGVWGGSATPGQVITAVVKVIDEASGETVEMQQLRVIVTGT